MDPNDRGQLVEAIQQALVGGGREENFARHVRDLTAAYLVQPRLGAPFSTVGAE